MLRRLETLVADYVGNPNLLDQVYGRKFHHRFTELYGSRTFREIYMYLSSSKYSVRFLKLTLKYIQTLEKELSAIDGSSL